MNIIKEKWRFLNSTEEYIPSKLSKLYRFGLQTFAARRIESLRANARIVPLNWNTAKSKAYRLTSNRRIVCLFVCMVQKLNLVEESDIIVVDFSDFGNGFQVLMFAKQTRRGRAVPVYFEILRYPITKGSQNLFVMNAIKHFSDILMFKPRLVFDRGFACPHIIQFLIENKYIFIIRIKKTNVWKHEEEECFLRKRVQDMISASLHMDIDSD